MFKKTTTKNFLLCIFITMLGSLLFIHLADVRYSVELVVFILFFSALSTFFTVYIFKNQDSDHHIFFCGKKGISIAQAERCFYDRRKLKINRGY